MVEMLVEARQCLFNATAVLPLLGSELDSNDLKFC